MFKLAQKLYTEENNCGQPRGRRDGDRPGRNYAYEMRPPHKFATVEFILGGWQLATRMIPFI